jgi:23S rRNA (uracil1939-C5)-methyltransferase
MSMTRDLELDVASLAAGGDGVGRDANGRVTFVPRTAPGDHVRARIVKETRSFARAKLVSVTSPSAFRVEPACPHFTAGCGGCAWQHVARAAQLAAKHTILTSALRNVEGLVIEPLVDPGPPLGWRRRARFHVEQGRLGLFEEGSTRLISIDHCPQLEPGLDAALAVLASAQPPDGELHVVRGWKGEIVVGVADRWPEAQALVGRCEIAGVSAGDDTYGNCVIELEPGLRVGPFDFAQASATGNAALVAIVRSALGKGPGRLLELFAGGGNLTRGFIDDGWDVLATDASSPSAPLVGARFEAGDVERVLARVQGPFDAVVLDPPRFGLSAPAAASLAELAAAAIVYVSCDAATLARDVARLADAGYRAERAWPLDMMPQTAHVEIVVRLTRVTAPVV